uniref:Uncharacterized protein n=1 Tax=Arundo donax TaxID=35708 RepID=A0A0A8Y7G8_ARUDO
MQTGCCSSGSSF